MCVVYVQQTKNNTGNHNWVVTYFYFPCPYVAICAFIIFKLILLYIYHMGGDEKTKEDVDDDKRDEMSRAQLVCDVWEMQKNKIKFKWNK